MNKHVTYPRCFLVVLLLLIGTAMFPPSSSGGVGTGADRLDSELYETGYKVFLMNGSIGNALRLAEKVLRERPDDVVWRKRAAQCAAWSGDPAAALRHLTHLALTMGDRDAADQAMKLATAIGDQRARLELLKQRVLRGGDRDTVRDFVAAAESLGETGEAVAFLESIKDGPHRKYALGELCRLYEADGLPDKAITAYLEYGGSYTLSAEALLRLATLRYGRGDLRGAYLTLKGGLKTAVADDPVYLEMTGDLCWRMQDLECAVVAARRLADRGKAREADFRRMIFVVKRTDPVAAYALARQGCERFGIPTFFNDVAETGELAGDWAELLRFVDGMRPSERAQLADKSGYWVFLAKVYGHAGRDREAASSYRTALRLEPGNAGLLAGYIWLLLDLNLYEEVQGAVGKWPENANRTPDLMDAMGAAMVYLGDYGNALVQFRQRSRAHWDDPLWLSAYAEVLEQNNLTQEAFAMRLRGLLLVRAGMKGLEPSPADLHRYRVGLAKYLLHLQKGDRLDPLAQRVMEEGKDDESRELTAAWLLSTERSDLARVWLWRRYGRNRVKPEWVDLTLALEENNRDRIAALLDDSPGRLPYRDAIDGARRVGSLPLSEELAWNRSWSNPDDYLLYNQVREYFSDHHSFAGYGFLPFDRGGVGGLENRLDLSVPLTRRLDLTAWFNHTTYTALESGVVGSLPSRDVSGMLGISGRFEHGKVSLSAGWRSALGDVVVADAALSYRLMSRLEINGALRYSAQADDTVPLSIGGVKDQATVNVVYSPTRRDTIQAGISGSLLRDQSRRLLGRGYSCSLDVAHKFSFNYPDVSARVFGGYYRYARDGIPQGAITTLLPSGTTADSTFFVPESFLQTGLALDVGQGYRDGYTKNWKPFGTAGITWTQTTGVGFELDLGTRGPLFGYDSLLFRVSVSRGTSATSSLSAVFEMAYRYYFN